MSARVRFVFIMMFVVGFLFVAPIVAKADVPLEVPEECQIYVDQSEDYFLAVIENYKNDLAFQKEQTEIWHAAHDLVAANAVARNIEYAAEVEKNRKLKDKLRYWKDLAQKWKPAS